MFVQVTSVVIMTIAVENQAKIHFKIQIEMIKIEIEITNQNFNRDCNQNWN